MYLHRHKLVIKSLYLYFCRLAESRDYILNNRLHQSQNRRFQTSVIDSEDFTDEDDDEADLLLPPKTRETGTGNSRKTWQEQEDHQSLNAETSPDSLASAASTSGVTSGPEVKYEGFTEFNYNNKSNTMNLS